MKKKLIGIFFVGLCIVAFGCSGNSMEFEVKRVDSLEELEDVVWTAIKKKNASLIWEVTDKYEVPDSMLEFWMKLLDMWLNQVQWESLEIKSVEEFIPPTKMPGEWEGKPLIYTREPSFWVIIYGKEKNVSDDVDPLMFRLFFPIMEVDGKFGFAGVRIQSD